MRKEKDTHKLNTWGHSRVNWFANLANKQFKILSAGGHLEEPDKSLRIKESKPRLFWGVHFVCREFLEGTWDQGLLQSYE